VANLNHNAQILVKNKKFDESSLTDLVLLDENLSEDLNLSLMELREAAGELVDKGYAEYLNLNKNSIYKVCF
jgi:hypothetical protein